MLKKRSGSKKRRFNDQIIAFQSDVDEIDNQPLPNAARWTLYSLLLLIVFLIGWSCITEIDKVITARGLIVTTADNLTIQPLEDSIIKNIPVRRGEIVKKGQALVTLDPTFADSDQSQLLIDIVNLKLTKQRLEAELSGTPFPPQGKNVFQTEKVEINPDMDPEQEKLENVYLPLQLATFKGRMQEYQSKLSSYEEQINENKSNLVSLKEVEKNLQNQEKFSDEMLSMRRQVYQSGADTRMSLLESERSHSEIVSRLENARKELNATQHELKQTIADKDAFISNWRNDISRELTETKNKLDSKQADLRKKNRYLELAELTAPVDAIVLELSKFTVGSVVKRGDLVMTLVPLNDELEVEAYVDPADIGYIRIGDACRVKLDTFEFQRHGYVTGTIRMISEDAYSIKLPSGDNKILYLVRIKITGVDLTNVPADFRLLPGMTLTADITVGTRKVITYVIYPIMRALDESIREP